MHVKYMGTLSPDLDHTPRSVRVKNRNEQARQLTQRTVVSGHFAAWATAFVWCATDTTHIIIVVIVVVVVRTGLSGIPSPLGDCVPMLDGDFHDSEGAPVAFRGGNSKP